MQLHERLGNQGAPVPKDLERGDPFAELKNRVHQALIADLGRQLFESSVDPDRLRRTVEEEVRRLIELETGIARADRDRLVGEIVDDTLGHGPLERLLADDSVSEIMVNGAHDVWVERDGRLFETTVRFIDDSHVRRIINKIVAQIGRRIDESSPMVDARLPDGSRVNAVIPPLSLSGPLRHHPQVLQAAPRPGRPGRLRHRQPETSSTSSSGASRPELNILISGGTGTGKTTLLNALSTAIPDARPDRHDRGRGRAAAEPAPRPAPRVAAEEHRGRGRDHRFASWFATRCACAPTGSSSARSAAPEALDMLQAMNTGHDGSLTTIHANTPRDALARLETMVLMAGFDLPMRAIREQVSSALDLIVHLERLEDGSRRVTSITEVARMESEVITLQELFRWEVDKVRSDREVTGELRPTGVHPSFLGKFHKHGVEMPPGLFGTDRGHEGRLSPTSSLNRTPAEAM